MIDSIPIYGIPTTENQSLPISPKCQHENSKANGKRSVGDRSSYLWVYACPDCGKIFAAQEPPNSDGSYSGHINCNHPIENLTLAREESRTCCGGITHKTKVFQCQNCGAEFRIE